MYPLGDKSDIEWTDATWNPMTGCSKISAGCANCYSERIVKRWGGSFKYKFHPNSLAQPGDWKKPRKIFVCSMSDLFQEEASDEEIRQVFEAMGAGPQHTYQILTKRIERVMEWHLKRPTRINLPSNIWIGTSVENQEMARRRIPELIKVRAKIRFLSVEPMLGPVSIYSWRKDIQWVIVGGESGPKARPLKPDWVRALRGECKALGIPFFFKQWGGLRPKQGGRDLDGRIWDEMPVTD